MILELLKPKLFIRPDNELCCNNYCCITNIINYLTRRERIVPVYEKNTIKTMPEMVVGCQLSVAGSRFLVLGELG
ncbi:MAG: hypothetical protein AMS27_01890 [Bacteroides sp. SM23_62_1]|nr:MAG: hypothetical protein AMS27_01890 [Bacteroides sp. SM23_62_1]